MGIICALGTSLMLHLRHMPFLYDDDYWRLSVQLSVFLVCAARLLSHGNRATLRERNRIVEACAPLVQTQVVMFYCAAAFWKVNSSFCDPKISCAPVLFVQLLAAYLPSVFVTPTVIAWTLRIAAPLTIAVEFTIPALIVQRKVSIRRFGIAFAILFHFQSLTLICSQMNVMAEWTLQVLATSVCT